MAKVTVKIGGAVADAGEIRYGWNTNPKNYEGLDDELGISELDKDEAAKNVVFGANKPKPPRVRISYGKKVTVNGVETLERKGSRTIYCDPDKVGRILGGSMRGKAIQVKKAGGGWEQQEIIDVTLK